MPQRDLKNCYATARKCTWEQWIAMEVSSAQTHPSAFLPHPAHRQAPPLSWSFISQKRGNFCMKTPVLFRLSQMISEKIARQQVGLASCKWFPMFSPWFRRPGAAPTDGSFGRNQGVPMPSLFTPGQFHLMLCLTAGHLILNEQD